MKEVKEGNRVGIINSGKIWPYAISLAILTFFGAIVFSISFILAKTPVEKSETYMMGYNHADLQANELIQAKIDFDKKYKISYIPELLSQKSTVLKYKVISLDGRVINDAKLLVRITRPDKQKYNQELRDPSIVNGVYTFKSVTLEKPGRWNVMAKVTVGDEEKFYNVKADTRTKEFKEY